MLVCDHWKIGLNVPFCRTGRKPGRACLLSSQVSNQVCGPSPGEHEGVGSPRLSSMPSVWETRKLSSQDIQKAKSLAPLTLPLQGAKSVSSLELPVHKEL